MNSGTQIPNIVEPQYEGTQSSVVGRAVLICFRAGKWESGCVDSSILCALLLLLVRFCRAHHRRIESQVVQRLWQGCQWRLWAVCLALGLH